MKMIGNSMTEGTPWKHILRFAMPVLAGSLLQQLYNTVDAVVVGKFAGEDALAAVGTTGSIAFLFLAVAMGFSQGNGVVVAQYYGAGNEKQVRKNASTGIVFLMGLGVLAAAVGALSADPVFTHLLHVQDSYRMQTLIYFRIYAAGLIFQFGYNIFSSILRAVGDSAATLYFLLIASVMNIILDLLFVAGFHWGTAGAAIATDIAQAVSFVAAYFYMTRRYPIFRFRREEYVFRPALAARTVNIGFPIALQLMVVSMGLTFIQRAVNEFGRAMTASFTVGQRIEMYLNLPCNAFQTTMATYTGQNVGAGKLERIRTGVRQTITISIIMTLFISGAVWLLSGHIIGLFGLSSEAAGYCIQHIHTVALINLILACYIPLFGVFQGTGHSIVPAFSVTIALTLRVIITYALRYSPFLGYSIIWWNGLFGFSTGFLVSWTYYLSGRWKRGLGISGPKSQAS